MPEIRKSNHLFLAGLCLFSASIFLTLSPWGRMLDRAAYDNLFCIRGTAIPPEDILIVAIDEPSFAFFKKQWPWPRSLHARLADVLFAAGARTVAMDIIFAEPSEPEEDAALAAAIERHPNLILANGLDVIDQPTYSSHILIRPSPEFSLPTLRAGIDAMPVEPDGFVRKSRIDFPSGVSLAYAAAVNYAREPDREQLEALRQTRSEIGINFIGPPRSIRTVSYSQVLEPGNHFPAGFFRDSLVFVGFSIKNSTSLESSRPDHYPVPFTRCGSGYLAGIEIQATVAANLIHGDYIRYLPPALLAITAAAAWLMAFACSFRMSFYRGGAFLLAGFSALWYATWYLFVQKNLYVQQAAILFPSAACCLGSLISRYAANLREKQFIRQTFARYVSPSVVRHLLKHPEQVKSGGCFARATVLCLDIDNFSGLARETPADRLVAVLSRYFEGFTHEVLRHDGMIDKIIGDGMMAVWGVPSAQENHAELGCRSALAILRTLGRRHEEDLAEGAPPLNIRIGINSGTVLAGNVGHGQFFNYTVHGVDVNIAARLEAVNKHYGTSILIGKNTADLLPDEFALREVDTICIRGQEAPQTIYELLGLCTLLDDRTASLLQVFDQALDLYRKRKWQDAGRLFEKGLTLVPGDGPCTVFRQRCLEFERHPPGPGWNGCTPLKFRF